MSLRFAVFFLTLLSTLGVIHFYVYRRTSRLWALSRRGRVALGSVFAAGLLFMVLGRALGELPYELHAGLSIAGSAVVLSVLIAAGLFLPVDLLVGAGRGARRIVAWLRTREADTSGSAHNTVRPERVDKNEGTALHPPLIPSLPKDAHTTSRTPGGKTLRQAQGERLGQARDYFDQPFQNERTEDPDQPSQNPSPSKIALARSLVTRRGFVQQAANGAALALGAGYGLYGTLLGRHQYVIEEVPLRIPGLSPRFDSYTIVQLSDIHFGTFAGEQTVAHAVDLVRKARPDVVVLTGDLLDHDAAYAPFLGSLVRKLSSIGRDGVVAIPGNHDYYAGIGAVLETLRKAGAEVLVNQGKLLGDVHSGVALLGVDDVWSRRSGEGPGPDVAAAIQNVSVDLPRVLLCHNPSFFPEAAPHVQLQLSGHTHGGQVNPVVRLADLVLPHGYVAGRYVRGESQLYVNRGFGTAGPPARVEAPPEVTRIVLTS